MLDNILKNPPYCCVHFYELSKYKITIVFVMSSSQLHFFEYIEIFNKKTRPSLTTETLTWKISGVEFIVLWFFSSIHINENQNSHLFVCYRLSSVSDSYLSVDNTKNYHWISRKIAICHVVYRNWKKKNTYRVSVLQNYHSLFSCPLWSLGQPWEPPKSRWHCV